MKKLLCSMSLSLALAVAITAHAEDSAQTSSKVKQTEVQNNPVGFVSHTASNSHAQTGYGPSANGTSQTGSRAEFRASPYSPPVYVE